MPRHTLRERGIGRVTGAITASLGQRLAPEARGQQGPLASITGNVQAVRGAGDRPLDKIATGGSNAFEFGEGAGGSFDAIQQLLNPSLTQQQTGGIAALQKGIAAGGLIGGAADFASFSKERNFLAGNRLQGLQQVTGQVRSRLEEFRTSISPLAELVGQSQSFLGGKKGGSILDFLSQRQSFSEGLLGSDAGAGAVFSGLESLGRGAVGQAALFGQLGNVGQGLRDNLDATDENALLLAATQQFLNPTLSGAQVNDPRSPTGQVGSKGPGNELELALNKLRGGSVLSTFFQQQLGGLNQGLAELEAFGGGLVGGQAGGQDAESILGADVSQFQNLLRSVGLVAPEGRGGPQVGSATKTEFLSKSEEFRNIISPIAPRGPTLGIPGIRI